MEDSQPTVSVKSHSTVVILPKLLVSCWQVQAPLLDFELTEANGLPHGASCAIIPSKYELVLKLNGQLVGIKRIDNPKMIVIFHLDLPEDEQHAEIRLRETAFSYLLRGVPELRITNDNKGRHQSYEAHVTFSDHFEMMCPGYGYNAIEATEELIESLKGHQYEIALAIQMAEKNLKALRNAPL